MKTSLKKLQRFAALRHDKRAPKQYQPIAHDELARATQDMNDMRDCYDSLLSAAAATANSVYEFSESLTEMGDCLLEKTALNDDEESGKVLLMLGKVQFELQKLVDAYRSHIFRTITVPSESLLNELCIVEEMKKQCDGKREIYEDMMEKQKEKGRLRGSKGECFSSCQLQAAHDEYDEVANVFVLRVKSLKQAQSHSLLTQASRHHAAQLCFFKKAMKSLEAIEPDVRLVSEQQHIDYQFSGVKDDELEILDNDDEETDSDEDFDTEDGSGSEIHDDGELSFEHGQNGPVQEAPSTKHLMELDDTLVSPETKLGAAKKLFPSARRNSFSFGREMRAICKSAPLFPDKKHSSSSPSRRKFTSYVLPTPDQTKGPFSGKLEDNKAPQTKRAPTNLWHSSPLNPNKYGKLRTNDKFSGPIILDAHSVLKESNNTRKASQLPPPLSEGLSFNPKFVSNAAKKVKRQQSAFSGPIITSKTTWPNSTNPNYFSASGPIVSSGYPPPFSGPLLRAPLAQPTSTPKISELHELPRPPPNHLAAKKPTNHSGPLLTQRHAPLESSVNPKITYNIMSPPLTPVSLTNIQPVIES